MRLQAAPLGASVPWTDLTTLVVPSIQPGDSIDVATEVSTPRSKPLGEFSRVPPRKLLTALGSEDEPQPQANLQPQPQAVNSWASLFALLFGKRPQTSSSPTLPV